MAVLNPTDTDQTLKLELAGVNLAGTGTLWRLASTQADAKNPAITSAPLPTVPPTVTVPRFSVSIYELPAR